MTTAADHPTAAGTLDLWERALLAGPDARSRGLALATHRDDDGGSSLPADLPLGAGHRRLLALRRELLGPALCATSPCPACGETVEFDLDATALLVLDGAPGMAIEGAEDASAEQFATGEVTGGGWTVTWRAPTPADLAAAASTDEPAAALRRACLSAVRVDEPAQSLAPAAEPPAELLDTAERAMAAADPLAEILVAVVCPGCGAGFDADVDLAPFVWAEVDALAQRLLHDIDTLARAYGWTEPEVLALTEQRRAAYVRLATAGVP